MNGVKSLTINSLISGIFLEDLAGEGDPISRLTLIYDSGWANSPYDFSI
jgi:hypothetical protein